MKHFLHKRLAKLWRDRSGGSVSVLVTYNYTYLIGGMLGFDPVDLQGRSTMIIN